MYACTSVCRVVMDPEREVRCAASTSMMWLIDSGGNTGPMLELFAPSGDSKIEDASKRTEHAIDILVQRVRVQLDTLDDEFLTEEVIEDVLVVVSEHL